MARENMVRAREKGSGSSVGSGASASPGQVGAEMSNGRHVDRLTRELGRVPTWEERVARARAAAERMGYGKNPPPPVRKRTPEEHAAMVAETDRIREAIRKDLNGWQFKGTQFIRDLRDGKLKDEPNAYWIKPGQSAAVL